MHGFAEKLLAALLTGCSIACAHEAEIVFVAPRRLDGKFDWSRPFLTSDIVLVARIDAPVVHSLLELANLPVGTVAGDRYPEIELPLGTHFLRDDAPSVESMFRKLAASRSLYAIVDETEVLYQMNKGKGSWLRPEFKIASLATRCAFSLKSRVPFAAANSAIESLIADGSVKRILARCRDGM